MMEDLIAENQRLKARVAELERQLQMRPRTRRKGAGAHYAHRLRRLNYSHRRLLYGLLSSGATDKSKGIPAVQLRRIFRLRTAPTAGRMAELIGKEYVNCDRARVTFQPDGEGVLQFRPETQIDTNIGIKRYKLFVYWITEAGIEALYREMQPTDDFIKIPELEVWLRIAKPEQIAEIQRLLDAKKSELMGGGQ